MEIVYGLIGAIAGAVLAAVITLKLAGAKQREISR